MSSPLHCCHVGQSPLAAARVGKLLIITIARSDSQLSLVITKNYSTAPRVPMGIWGQYVTPEPRFSGLVLDHQGLEELELKSHPKNAFFDQIWLFLSGFLILVLLKADGRAPNP